MVAGGITGELKIDSRIEGIETQVRAVNEQLFGIVSKEASDAVTSAHNADIAAGNAQAKANAADKSAGKAHQEIDAALKQLTELQARIAWRSISDEQKKTLKDALRPFHGRTISLTWDGVDPEQNSFGLQLRVALHDAGLNVRLDISGLSILGPPENAVTGILIEGNDPTFIKGLAKVLVSASLVRGPIPVFPMNTSDGNPEIRIRPKAP